MKHFTKLFIIGVGIMLTSGCSVFGNSGVEIAPYDVVESDGKIEVRLYERMVLVSAPMRGGLDDSSDAFQKLFRYISGANQQQDKIAMTAPVLMEDGEDGNEEGQKIAMTAPVLMGTDQSAEGMRMSFVLPAEFTLETAPKPTDPEVSLSGINDFRVAVIRFSGLLREGNIEKNREALETWIAENNYTKTGPFRSAGYNPPWTLPNMRRNEVMIPVRK